MRRIFRNPSDFIEHIKRSNKPDVNNSVSNIEEENKLLKKTVDILCKKIDRLVDKLENNNMLGKNNNYLNISEQSNNDEETLIIPDIDTNSSVVRKPKKRQGK